MSETVPFAARRDAIINRAVEIFSADPRILAGWLEGSLADGSADPYSDIDLHLCVVDEAWDQVWSARRELVGQVAPILASLDVPMITELACLVEGPAKLDVIFEKHAALALRPRIAVKPLWGASELLGGLKVTDDLGDRMIRQALESNVLGFLQGATWPVRLLARNQTDTFLYCEILLIETGLIPLMLLEKDRRALHRNMFARSRLISAAQREECARLVDRVTVAVRAGDRAAMRDIHIEIHRRICELARAAFRRYGLEFPPRVEEAMVAFYQREWP